MLSEISEAMCGSGFTSVEPFSISNTERSQIVQ